MTNHERALIEIRDGLNARLQSVFFRRRLTPFLRPHIARVTFDFMVFESRGDNLARARVASQFLTRYFG